MIQVHGLWMPDDAVKQSTKIKPSVRAKEIEPGGSYRSKRCLRAMAHCKSFRTAVDVGAHVGTQTKLMAKRFQQVEAFEPLAAHIECFEKNVQAQNVKLWPYAAGDRDGIGCLYGDAQTSIRIGKNGAQVWIVTLDGLNLTDVDFLKIDTEGYEMAVLSGAKVILERDKPVVMIEQKPSCTVAYGYRELEAIEFLKKLGAKHLWSETIDHCMAWP